MKSMGRILLAVLLLAGIGFIPLPGYELERLSPAMNAKDFVQIQGGSSQKSGEIYLLAVGVSEARVFSLLLALLPDYSLEPSFINAPANYFDKDKEREELENSTMASSQLNALQVAYRAANRPVEVVHKNIYVNGVSRDTALAKELQQGDLILKVDNQSYSSPYDIVDQMEQRKVGDVVSIEYSRRGVIGLASAPLIVDEVTGKPGLGVEFGSVASVLMNPLASFKSNGVGGSSGGLMFSLELYNQLVAEDITKGKVIAGTGTIDHKGDVGRIGGVEMKVRAADQAGAQIFFVPDDSIDPEIAQYNPKLRSNYHEALRAAIRIKSKMQIVPVKTFDEALNYLREME
ncbi:SepM family pheromone-processing serine protease [Streptococcus panodentis]|uniref:Serine protease n=1 Tax=Streptococcus panodentis TaxID=1581472 RepID=A0ABS5AUS0_9STRE|nr:MULTISPECIES: SepM family pheromone-processing serine protease [Streptococcus]KXT84994.1 Lon-like protease with PDZ domain [Streptococcus sp. DD11]MBP2620319.1 serine protease [Streptococcus panodentis]